MHQAVERMLRDSASKFPHATVRTDVWEPGGPPLMELSCSLPGTMRIQVLAGADQIDLYLGEAIWRELIPTRRRQGDQLVDAARTIVEAALAGRFEEKVCEAGGKIQASRYVLHRPGKRSPWPLRLRPIFIPGRRRLIRYAPYG